MDARQIIVLICLLGAAGYEHATRYTGRTYQAVGVIDRVLPYPEEGRTLVWLGCGQTAVNVYGSDAQRKAVTQAALAHPKAWITATCRERRMGLIPGFRGVGCEASSLTLEGQSVF